MTPLRLLPLLALLALTLPASASAAADIEKVWSFTGGQVAVRANADGSFTGTIIRPTRLSECTHPNGEQMWIEVRAQPDGSYWGKHQWYRTPGCEPIPERGNTAYRVLRRPDGQVFLRVCFANPDEPSKQPTIAADGTSANTSVACSDSDLVGELPAGTPKVDQIATLPKQGKKKCLSRRSFRIRLKEPPGDALDTAAVFVNNRRVAIRRGERITAPVNLRGLPRGRYTVKIVATTVLGRKIQGSRRYRTCTKRRRGGSRAPL